MNRLLSKHHTKGYSGVSFITVLRIILGLFFIISGLSKLFSIAAFQDVLVSYAIFPNGLLMVISYGIPIAECVLGSFVIVQYRTGSSSFMLLVLVFTFTVAAYIQYQNGQITDCGCFGGLIERKNDWTFFVGNTLLMGLLSYIFYYEGLTTDN